MSKPSNHFVGLSPAANKTFAVIGLAVLSPVMLIIAALVKVSSKGPVLFRQIRVGADGVNFTMLKFRTMTHRSKGSNVTAANDRRVTRFGAILRRYKLDELPELINVFRGEMAFVGPRPEIPEMVDLNDKRWILTLKVAPGITDPVTLLLRNEESHLAKVEDKEAFYVEVLQPFKLNGYLNYLQRRTWKSDVLVILRTVVTLFLPNDKELVPLEEGTNLNWEQST